MKRSIDTHLFLEIIQNEGAIPVSVDVNYNLTAEMYLRNGAKVLIVTSDEFISERVAKSYLDRLDLRYLIPNLFP